MRVRACCAAGLDSTPSCWWVLSASLLPPCVLCPVCVCVCPVCVSVSLQHQRKC